MREPLHPNAFKPGEVRVIDGEEYACVVLKCAAETVAHLSEAVPCSADICGGCPFSLTLDCISSEHDAICRSTLRAGLFGDTAPIIVPRRVVPILALHGDLA